MRTRSSGNCHAGIIAGTRDETQNLVERGGHVGGRPDAIGLAAAGVARTDEIIHAIFIVIAAGVEVACRPRRLGGRATRQPCRLITIDLAPRQTTAGLQPPANGVRGHVLPERGVVDGGNGRHVVVEGGKILTPEIMGGQIGQPFFASFVIGIGNIGFAVNAAIRLLVARWRIGQGDGGAIGLAGEGRPGHAGLLGNGPRGEHGRSVIPCAVRQKDMVTATARQVDVLVYGRRRRWVVFPGAPRAVAVIIANFDDGIVRRRSPIGHQGVHPVVRLCFPFFRRCVVPVPHAPHNACCIVELRIPDAQPVGQVVIGHRLANGGCDRLHARIVEVVPAHDVGHFLSPRAGSGIGAAIGADAANRQRYRRLYSTIDAYATRINIHHCPFGIISGVAIRLRRAVGNVPEELIRSGTGTGILPMLGHTRPIRRIKTGRPGPE